jgi:hypothetical protein
MFEFFSLVLEFSYFCYGLWCLVGELHTLHIVHELISSLPKSKFFTWNPLATTMKVMCDPPLHCFLVLSNIKNVNMICIYGFHQISWFGTQISISIGRGERGLSWKTQNLSQNSKLIDENVKINKTT